MDDNQTSNKNKVWEIPSMATNTETVKFIESEYTVYPSELGWMIIEEILRQYWYFEGVDYHKKYLNERRTSDGGYRDVFRSISFYFLSMFHFKDLWHNLPKFLFRNPVNVQTSWEVCAYERIKNLIDHFTPKQ